MQSIFKVFFLLCALSLLSTLFILAPKGGTPNLEANFLTNLNLMEVPRDQVQVPLPVFPDELFYQFKHPQLADFIISKLEDPTLVKHPNRFSVLRRSKEKFHYGLKFDDRYCAKNRRHFVLDVMSYLKSANILMTSAPEKLYRQIATTFYHDSHPEVGDHMKPKKKNSATISLKPELNLFGSKNSLYHYMTIGAHYSCLAQESNHIFGHETLDRKDRVAESAIAYAKKFEDRLHCFNHDKFFPRTWLLDRKEDCKEFFNILDSEKYQEMKKERNIVYIRKIAVFSHRGEGVQPVNDQEEQALREAYKNGLKCGKMSRNYIIQHYVHNPLLINGRKFDFRMYMLIASVNPLIAYYHDGFLRVTLAQYNISSNDKDVFLTNMALNHKIYDDMKEGKLHEGMDEEALRHHTQWTFDRFQDYLLEKNIISDPNWLDNYLRPEFKKAMIHLIRLSSHNFKKHSSLYELYGVDFMLDENLNLWFIEANSSPAFNQYYDPLQQFIVKMLKDHFEIALGLLRSRMKRVVMFVNQIIEEGNLLQVTGRYLPIAGFQGKKELFRKITQNYFEKEFEPIDNGFSKIIDENYKGSEAYQGLLSQECLQL